ncbi:MAG: hypothetical protein H7339_04045 [Arcicella sp.]|nr:hypothetical protein [Arcicella sp.]
MNTVIEEKIEIAPELLEQVQTQVEKQVIVHGVVAAKPPNGHSIRLWKSIVLIPHNATKRCRLIQSYNIALYPEWQYVNSGKPHHFTMIFEGLPTDCLQFDVLEIIPEPYGFEVRNIHRNEQDVYYLSF